MDIYGIKTVVDALRKKDNEDTFANKDNNGGSLIGLIVFLVILTFILGIPAAYLSWTSNTVAGWDDGPKIIFAFFALFNGLSYLISHLIYKVDLLNVIKNKCRR